MKRRLKLDLPVLVLYILSYITVLILGFFFGDAWFRPEYILKIAELINI
jgi:hypothetical protein